MTQIHNQSVFDRLKIPQRPAILAPLAGVSDYPFRLICSRLGADLTYVEMLSATALLYKSQRTFDMIRRHAEEGAVGIQITGKTSEEVGDAIAILDAFPFETIDINMGCPVNKVVRSGCGSAILKDPERVFKTVSLARQATKKPLSAKIRLGWDAQSKNFLEVADAVARGGADWITVHGRTRASDYSDPVDLVALGMVKRSVQIPVIGNGNIFTDRDAEWANAKSGVDGLMVSRGALGNPWVFRDIKAGRLVPVSVQEWTDTVLEHLALQQEAYVGHSYGAVCMRKHLLWYARGWQGAKKLRESINHAADFATIKAQILSFSEELIRAGVTERDAFSHGFDQRAEEALDAPAESWDPKWDMDRSLDRGVGDDRLVADA